MSKLSSVWRMSEDSWTNGRPSSSSSSAAARPAAVAPARSEDAEAQLGAKRLAGLRLHAQREHACAHADSGEFARSGAWRGLG